MDNLSNTGAFGKPPFQLPRYIFKEYKAELIPQYVGHLYAKGIRDPEEITRIVSEELDKRCESPCSKDLKWIHKSAYWICSREEDSSSHTEGSETLPCADIPTWLAYAETYSNTYAWAGSFGLRCRVAVMLMLAWMRDHKRIYMALSCRDLELMTGFSKNTCATILKALSGRDKNHTHIPRFFRCIIPRKQHKKEAYLYELLNLASLTQTGTHILPPYSVSDACPLPVEEVHEAFRGRNGLSLTCWLIYQVILNHTVKSAKEITKIGRFTSERYVSTCLTKLSTAGLIEKKGVWQATAKPLDVVAQERGSAGHCELAKKRIAWEREQWKTYLENGGGSKRKHLRLIRRYNDAPEPESCTAS